MNIGNGMYLEQTLTLSMNQIQSLEVLAMDTPELQKLVKDEYLENPMFDYRGDHRSASDPMTYAKSYREAVENKDQFLSNLPMPEENRLKDYILGQLQNPREKEEQLAEYLVNCLDDSGFLTISEEEIAKGSGRPVEDVKRMIEKLQELEPYGIFQPDLPHCLMKQLEIAGKKDGNAYRILKDHYAELLNGKISSITRSMKVTTAEVRRCIEEIAELNPYPKQGFQTGSNHYIKPDIIAERENGVWTVRLNDDWVEDYGISDYYLSLMKTTRDPGLRQYFEKKLDHAKLLINNIVQRRKTIEQVTRKLIEYEEEYFEGRGPLRPITMTYLSELLNISPSTVSRALRGKYLQYPGGTVLLRKLFTTSTYKEHSTEVSAETIQERVRGIISREDKAHPLSDQAIAKKLGADGIAVSRRAVAKYRDALGIQSSFERKEQ